MAVLNGLARELDDGAWPYWGVATEGPAPVRAVPRFAFPHTEREAVEELAATGQRCVVLGARRDGDTLVLWVGRRPPPALFAVRCPRGGFALWPA